VEPVRSIYIYPSEIPYFIIFGAFASLISWFSAIRRRAEEALREQANLLNLTHDSIFVMDMEGMIKYWNCGAEEQYGWTAEQAVGKVVHDLLKTVFPTPREQIKAEVTRTGRWEGELVHTKKDGTQVVVASRWSLQRDKQGAPVAILETNNDITEHKRAEVALRRLNRELRAISNCNQTVLRATDEQSLLDDICRIVCQEAGYRMAWVAYAEHDEAKSVRPAAWTGAEEGYLANLGITWAETERGRSPTGTAIRTGKTCCIQDFATDPRLAPWRESALQHGFLSGIALPLKDEHANAFGSLSVYSAQPNTFAAEEIQLLEELAADLAFGIVTLRSRAARKRAEEEVSLLSFALDKVHEAALLIDDRGRFQYVNEEACRVLGYSRAELLGLGVSDIDPEFPGERWADHWRDLQAQRSLSFESRHRTKDGRVFPVEISANYFEFGGRAYNLGLVRDITERKRADEALRRSEAYLAEAQRLAHTGSWAWSPATLQSLYWSEEMFRIFGLNPEEGVPTTETFWQRIHPEDLDRTYELLMKAAAGNMEYAHDHRIVLPDGTVKHIHAIGHPVLDEHGQVAEYVGTAVDMTERKQAEEALRDSETRFRTFVDHAEDAFFMLDEQGTIIDVNRSACGSLGYTRQELIGMTSRAFDVNLDQATLESVPERTAAGETVLFDKHWHRRKDGSTFPVEVQTSLVSYGGRRLRLKVARDISDRLRTEEQRKKLRQLEADLAHLNRVSMMGELTTSIAHEVNQPISGVVSNGSACLRWLAGDAPNVEEAREAARRIVRDGKRAGEVIARVRALTKRAATPREKLDLNETIRDVLALVGDEAKRNSVIIRIQFLDDLSPVLGDRVQLQQVALNLVMNAMEAMSSVDDRPRELLITTRNLAADQVQVTVKDSGPGIDPDLLDKIFDPFYTTKPGGMGMGLTISRSILQAHGGRLWVAAKDGPGTIFHFSLPKYQEEESNAPA
jgi:PAS domain S-box-containing protein